MCFTQVWHTRDDDWDSCEQGDMPSWAFVFLCLGLHIWHSADIAPLTLLWKP